MTEDEIFAAVRACLWSLQNRSHFELRDFLVTMGINLTGIEVSRRNRAALLKLSEQCAYDWRGEALRSQHKEDTNGTGSSSRS